ncbi:MAG: hypothetical protein QNJ44_10340 [Rhodobacter sp.]|nr:hypothetical protein [Rhodobacter sp.]
MSRPNPALLFGFLVAVIVILAGVTLAKGGFFIAKHEGDTLHLLQIVFRMASGEWPHLDFMTPIGWLAFAPIALFVNLGMGIGHAILFSQILVAFVLLPAVFWAGMTRFAGALAYLFGLVVLVLVMALVHGEAERSVSISMHYNRWAWAVCYVVIVLALLPPREIRNDRFDGVMIGVGMAALALLKVTYFAAFAVPVAAALTVRGAIGTLRVAVLSGLIAAVAVTILAGAAFWSAYIGDLLAVFGSEVRPQPGAGLRTIIGAPAYLGGSLTLVMGVILLRQADEPVLGLVLLLLTPGFLYVTYQNFGNDPQWLMLLAILLLVPSPRPELVNGLGWNMKAALRLAAMAAIAFAAPSFLNLAYSPFRHLGLDAGDYQAMLTRTPQHRDLRLPVVRANQVNAGVALDGPGSGLENRARAARREETLTEFRGELMPDCELQLGLIAWFETIVGDLEEAGLAEGKRVFAADLFSGHWLFGDLQRLENGAPWYYGELAGFDSADYLLVPLCPTAQDVRKQILEDVAGRGTGLVERRRTALYVLYEISER